MIDNKPFAMFFNASPRKGWNTYKMLEAAKAGAEEAGAITELVNLYDIKFPGCESPLSLTMSSEKALSIRRANRARSGNRPDRPSPRES